MAQPAIQSELGFGGRESIHLRLFKATNLHVDKDGIQSRSRLKLEESVGRKFKLHKRGNARAQSTTTPSHSLELRW